MTFLSTETCGTCEEVAAELRRLRAACESMAEQLERASAPALESTLPREPLEALAMQLPSLRGWCRREALMLHAALAGGEQLETDGSIPCLVCGGGCHACGVAARRAEHAAVAIYAGVVALGEWAAQCARSVRVKCHTRRASALRDGAP